MANTSSAPKKSSRLIHAVWITAVIFFVATPDGEGATKSVPARAVAAWLVGL